MDYSIIVPHHNSAKLVDRLLESIPMNGRFQVIVVDDNSSPDEYKAVAELQSKYSFELFTNEGKTAGGARNTGVKYAKADWLLFADADDYYEPGIEALVDKYKDSDYDIVYFNVTSRYTETGEVAYRNQHVQSIAKKAMESGDFDYLRLCHTVPWGKLIRRSVVTANNIMFDEVPAGNDMWFAVNVGLNAPKVCYDENALYCITVTGNSITTTLTRDKFESRLQVTLRVNDLLREKDKKPFRISILYFVGSSHQFGIKYFFHVLGECIKHKSDFTIGMEKMLHIGSVMKNRQNTSVSKKK